MKNIRLKAYTLGAEKTGKISNDYAYLLYLKNWLRVEHSILVEVCFNFIAQEDDELGWYSCIIRDFEHTETLKWDAPGDCVDIQLSELDALKIGINEALNFLI